MTAPETLRYPARALALDYARSIFGSAATLGPFAVAPESSIMFWILGSLGGLFVIYGLRTALRHATVYRLEATGFAAAGLLPRRVDWGDIETVSLRYFSTRRDRSNGWMQLTLGAGRRRLAIDSGLPGFSRVVQRAARAAAMRGLVLDANTAENIDALTQGRIGA